MLMFKESTFHCRRWRRCGFDPWVRKIPWSRKWQLAPIFLPGKIPRTKESAGLYSMGLQRVGHNWATEYTHVYCLNICDKQLAWFGSLILNIVSDIQKPSQTIYWKSDRKIHVSSLTFTKLCDFLCKLPIIQKISLKRQYLPKWSLCAECSVRRPGPR